MATKLETRTPEQLLNLALKAEAKGMTESANKLLHQAAEQELVLANSK